MITALGLLLRPAGDTGVAVFTTLSFALIFFYDVLFEVLGRGRTPGKRASGLRVVAPGGRPITFARSAVRNLLRLIDILPGFYAVGMTVIFITTKNQRIGDLAAGAMWSATATATARRPRVGSRRSTPRPPRPGT